MAEVNEGLKPSSASEIADLLYSEPQQKFVRGVTCDKEGRRSLYGQILHVRGVADEQLMTLPEKDAQSLAFQNVTGVTNHRQLLIDYVQKYTASSRSDLMIGRTVTALVNPRLILGNNAELIITLGEMVEYLPKTNPPTTRNINWDSLEVGRAYSRCVKGTEGYIPDSKFMPVWYAQMPVRQAWAQFGDEVAKVASLAANELQNLPELPVDPIDYRSKVTKFMEETTSKFADRFGQTYFTHQLILPGNTDFTVLNLVRWTNARLRRQPSSQLQNYDVRVFIA